MNPHSNPQTKASQTLAALLAEHPEITGFTWSIDPSGVVHGGIPDDNGRSVADVARITGGTPATSTTANPAGDRLALPNSGGDRLILTELVAVWRDTHFAVWSTHEVQDARPLGAVVPYPAGGAQ